MIEMETMGRSKFLAKLIKENKYRRIAEIGVKEGYNARNILNEVKLDRFYLVDIMIPKDAVSLKQKCIRRLVMTSVKASGKFKDGSLDLVFIDADHKYKSVRKDIEVWLPKIKKDGIISGHDYGGGGEKRGIEKAIREKFGTNFNLQREIRKIYIWWKYV